MNYFIYKNSTINWCEDDHLYSGYIKEWYNTISGLCLCITPFVFYTNNSMYSNYINKFYKILLFQILTGIGTILFHGTLLYIFQMVDEIPMILLCSEYVKILQSIYNRILSLINHFLNTTTLFIQQKINKICL